MAWDLYYRKRITPELTATIAEHFRKGATDKIVAGLVDLPRGVIRHWLSEGEAQLELAPEERGPESLVFVAVQKAKAEYLMDQVKGVNAMNDEWRANAWLLERRDEEFAAPRKVEISGPDDGPILVQGQAVLGLADIVSLAGQLGVGHLFGLPGPDSQPALPEPAEVLPDSGQREPAAVPLPDVSRP